MVNEPYPIRNADGKLFCLCQNTAAGPVLMTKNCKMPMDEFLCHQVRDGRAWPQ